MSAPINLSSRVRAVTVYRRGAMVTREAELLRAGSRFPARVQLVGLPLTLDDSSVRVEVAAVEDRAAPVAGDLRMTLSVPDEDAELPPPTNDELDRAQLELELASETRDQLVRARARLSNLQPVGRGRPEEGKPPAPSPTSARLELLEFRRERSEALGKQIQAAEERVRVATEQLRTLRERERVASSARNTRTHELRKAAILELDHTHGDQLASRAVVRLHYFVPGARWAPAYTVRLDRAMRAASLELRALVGQSTGEDWQDVALTLSTATPQQWTELPELQSKRIGRRQPPPAKTGWRPPPVGADELYADFDRGLGQPEPEPEPGLLDDELELAGDAPRRDLAEMLQAHGAVDGAPMPPPGPPMSMSSPMVTRSGAPPPGIAPQAMPSAPPRELAMMVAAAPERSKRGGLGAIVGGIAGGIASAFSDDGGEHTMTFGAGGGGPAGAARFEPEPDEGLVAGRDLLDYGRLRMFPGSSPRRGSLRRIDMRMQYEQHCVESLRIDVAVSQIREAVEWARLLETEQPPEGHSWPASEGGFDYAYVAEARVDLASTGAFTSLPIELREAEAKPRYVSVPRETQDVFRIVALRNPLDAPLLPGPADVYVAGKFALTSKLALTPIGGRIELGLGVEQAIKIARNVSFSEDSSGMFKRQLELVHTIAVEVQNHLPTAANVEVRERVPIVPEAMVDDIEVAVTDVTPAWDDWEPKRIGPKLEGGHVWKIEVPAGGKRELAATWKITIATNHELVGGNRRDS